MQLLIEPICQKPLKNLKGDKSRLDQKTISIQENQLVHITQSVIIVGQRLIIIILYHAVQKNIVDKNGITQSKKQRQSTKPTVPGITKTS